MKTILILKSNIQHIDEMLERLTSGNVAHIRADLRGNVNEIKHCVRVIERAVQINRHVKRIDIEKV